jgi:hypothetical protein
MDVTPRELTEKEFLATMSAPMCDVTHTAKELVDLWGYADPIIEAKYHSCTAWEWRVSSIYESPDGAYQHETETGNVFLGLAVAAKAWRPKRFNLPP